MWIRANRSWHRLQTWTRVPQRAVTICGRVLDPVTIEAADIPSTEKSCESCLRLYVAMTEMPATET